MQWTLEALRVAAGLTQKELAEEFDVSSQTIARLENDSSNINVAILKKYMTKFHVSFDDIFLGKKYENFVYYFFSSRLERSKHETKTLSV